MIARVNLQNRHVHLFRFCPRDVMHDWAAHLWQDTQEWLSQLTDLPLLTPHALAVLHSPVGYGGLGFLNPQHEAALHFLQAMLPLVEELPRAAEGENPVALQIAQAFEHLEHQAGGDLRTPLQQCLPHRMGRKLRELFYEGRGRHMRDVCPWLQLPGLPATTAPELTWTWQVRCQMAWYTATSHTFLHAGPLRYALQKHMGLPVYHPGQRCCYTPLTTGRRCHHQLGAFSDHTFTCAQGPSLRRHNRVRDAWIALCRQAGWHTDAEQLVYIQADETKRADFVAHTPQGERLACDVMVTAAPTPWSEHGTHLHRSSAAKATRYGTVPWGYTHDRAQLVPLVLDAHNFWVAGDGLRLLHRLVAATARRHAPVAPLAWGAHFTATTAAAAAPLMHALVISSWQMHAACGRVL